MLPYLRVTMIEAPERGCFLRESGYSRRTADVAQLVEHFTRNEGVPGSSPGVGLGKALETGSFPSPPPLQEIQRDLGANLGATREIGRAKQAPHLPPLLSSGLAGAMHHQQAPATRESRAPGVRRGVRRARLCV